MESKNDVKVENETVSKTETGVVAKTEATKTEATKTAQSKPKTNKVSGAKKDAPKKTTPKKTTPKKTVEKKPTEKKPAEKKLTEKQVVEKKATAKKPVMKKSNPEEDKTTLFIQYAGREYSQDDIIEKVYEKYTAETGKNTSAIKSLDIYVKPEENAAYYVINKKIAGRVEL